MTKKAAKKLKFGDLLVQTTIVFKGESKFIIAIKVEDNQLYHVHINKEKPMYINIRYFRKPYKSELTKKIMKQYKTALLKLSLKRDLLII